MVNLMDSFKPEPKGSQNPQNHLNLDPRVQIAKNSVTSKTISRKPSILSMNISDDSKMRYENTNNHTLIDNSQFEQKHQINSKTYYVIKGLNGEELKFSDVE